MSAQTPQSPEIYTSLQNPIGSDQSVCEHLPPEKNCHSESEQQTRKITAPAEQDAQQLLAHLPLRERALFWQYGEGPREKLIHAQLHHAFEQQVLDNPAQIAVEHEGQSISYETLDYYAEELATTLINSGVKPGDCVPLFLERSIAMVVGIVATLKVGAAYAPQHVGVAPDAQLTHIATALDAKVILTMTKFRDKVHDCTVVSCVAIDEFCRKVEIKKRDSGKPKTARVNVAASETSPHNTAMILFTSGTTGKPNGVRVTHHNLCNILMTSPGNLSIRPGIRVSQILSISFDMAAWEILGCICNGGTLLIRGKNIAETAKRAHVIIATPSILSRIPSDECRSVIQVAVAGEPCPRPLADEWSRIATFYNSCGPTETTIVNTMLSHHASSEHLSIGIPTPNNTVYILNDQGIPCRIGETGEMWAGGFAVTAGYLDNPELTAERYRDDPFLGNGMRMFNTRDLGRWTREGTLEHLGRTDDQVKIRGFRVELDSVSSVLEKQRACTRAAAIKLDDRTLIAFMSPLDVEPESAKQAVGAALPYYCVPEEIYVLPELPLTPRGKIDKRLLIKAAKFRRENTSHTSIKPGNQTQLNERKSDGRLSDSSVAEPEQARNQAQTKTARVESSDSENSLSRRLDAHQQRSDAAIENYQRTPLPDIRKSLRSVLADHRFYHYWRLMAVMLLLNLGVLCYGLMQAPWWNSSGIRLDIMMNMVVFNLTVAIIFRQQYVINLLFKIATSTPLSAPLRFRQLMGKVYHFGGIHVGGALCGTIWMFVALVSMFAANVFDTIKPMPSGTTQLAATQLLLTLVLLLVMAKPAIRQKFHNHFELVHRLGGWFSLAMFWVVALSFVNDQKSQQSLAIALVESPVFWALLITTFSIILPWLRLKKVRVHFEKPSDHVVLANFDYGVTPFAGSSTAVSRSPLTEWHSFANVPAPGESGFRLTISRAGDWTGRLIDDLPTHVWVKGIPTAGVGNVDQLFKRVVWIATGSGIGPTLPHLLAKEVPAHLVWSTRNARKTYGDKLVNEIVEVEPEAIIWDTDKLGRPDLVQMAYAAVAEFDAEAVIVIANEKLTRLVVSNMEARGIPAYGAIWDS